jgi:hypothetical protein
MFTNNRWKFGKIILDAESFWKNPGCCGDRWDGEPEGEGVGGRMVDLKISETMSK